MINGIIVKKGFNFVIAGNAVDPIRKWADATKIAISSRSHIMRGFGYSFQLAIISPPFARHWWRLPEHKNTDPGRPN